jgi:hypothetical protein
VPGLETFAPSFYPPFYLGEVSASREKIGVCELLSFAALYSAMLSGFAEPVKNGLLV